MNMLLCMFGVMIVYVMYDQVEVMEFGDWIVVMGVGCIEQIGMLCEIYYYFVNCMVVQFIGMLNWLVGQWCDGVFEMIGGVIVMLYVVDEWFFCFEDVQFVDFVYVLLCGVVGVCVFFGECMCFMIEYVVFDVFVIDVLGCIVFVCGMVVGFVIVLEGLIVFGV